MGLAVVRAILQGGRGTRTAPGLGDAIREPLRRGPAPDAALRRKIYSLIHFELNMGETPDGFV